MTESKVRQLNPLVMAFVGDGVFTLFIRTRLATESDSKAGALHKRANGFVKASAQAYFFDNIENMLTEDEKGVARRARNAHNNTMAKNATVLDYKKATSFEAVLGYLQLCGDVDRLNEIMEISYALGKDRKEEPEKDVTTIRSEVDDKNAEEKIDE